MEALSSHWQDLYAVSRAGGLQCKIEGGQMEASLSCLSLLQLPTLSCCLYPQLGRMAGPDLIRGEFFRGLYDVDSVPGPMCDKHVYDSQPASGDVLHDLCVLLKAAFDGSDVPAS